MTKRISFFQLCLLNILQIQQIIQVLPSVFFPFLLPLLRLTSLSSGGIWAIFCINTFSSSSAINTMSSPGCKIQSVPFSKGEAAVMLIKQPGYRVLPQQIEKRHQYQRGLEIIPIPAPATHFKANYITIEILSHWPIEKSSFTSASFYSKGQRWKICNSLIYPCVPKKLLKLKDTKTANKYPSTGRCSHFIRLNLLKEHSMAHG